MAEAQVRVPPPSREAIQYSYAPIVKRAAPAVVNVYVRSRVRAGIPPLFDDPFFRRFFGDGFGMPRERIQNSLGSGVIVSPDGIVVTNYHVIRGGESAEIRVALADRREFDAKVILQDEKTDIAVLRIEANGETFPTLELADSDA
ncbi:MAG TPA: trypsin-like peptidase domain-containing protein, partial [Hyphomicrobiaceae bacterium]|nr:trypsin-like peptidase domain-containing protein [Hyphomicrobiaceae bacterium]